VGPWHPSAAALFPVIVIVIGRGRGPKKLAERLTSSATFILAIAIRRQHVRFVQRSKNGIISPPVHRNAAVAAQNNTP
jgi:hypothetical protein